VNAITYDHICDTNVLRALGRSFALVCALVCGACVVVCAQEAVPTSSPNEQTQLIVEGDACKDVFGMGRSVVVRGHVNHGAMAFGGDVIIEGRVEGDVAAVGGSVIQRDGACIGGDVWVFGGTYHHGTGAPCRNPARATVMYAGYEDELRQLARDPVSTILTPHWTPAALGMRVLAVLFWFIVSLALTAATPGAISRAATRLHLTSLRVAVIGCLGAVVISFGVPAASLVLPQVVSVLIGALALLLLLVAYLFGRVAIHAATGRWLQRMLLAERRRSESVALLLGTIFWVVVLSLPYVWVLGVAGLLVTSLGLALTARYRLNWRLPAKG
jgi:ferredoxin